MNNDMNLTEKLLRISCLVLVLGSLVLRLAHVVDSTTGQNMLSFGFMFGIIAYSRYSRRLRRRNEELERQLEEQQPE
ncbi:hypothetical protein [Hymenobacter sp.]|jgi:hypothetical protein|uniref:hypothetical protein n=1 Tax=Hymenobacter sp. TaxID=1898978 RepID=UPI002EDA147D